MSVSNESDWWSWNTPNENDVRVTVSGGSLKLSGEGMVGYWSMDNEADNTVQDLTSNANLGAMKGGQGVDNYVSGVFDNGLEFDGENDYVEISDDNSLDMTEGLSVSFWINSELESGENQATVLMKGMGTNNFRISIGSDNSSDFVIFDNSENKYSLAAGAGVVEKNSWVHMVYTYNPSTGYMRIFKNGNEYTSDNIDDVTPLYTNNGDLLISSPDNSFGGKLDEIQVFDRSLSENEANWIFNRSKPDSVLEKGLNIGTWTSVVMESGYSSLDNLEFSATIDENENIYGNISSDIDNNGTMDENTGWNLLDNLSGVWNDLPVGNGYKFQVMFKLQTNNSAHSPTLSDWNLNATSSIAFEWGGYENWSGIISAPIDNIDLVNPVPSDGSIVSESISVELKVEVLDPNGDNLDVRFYDNSDNALVGSSTDVPSGSIASTSFSVVPGESYSWFATADNGTKTMKSEVWTFTVMDVNWIRTVLTGGDWWDSTLDADRSLTIEKGGLRMQENAVVWWNFDEFPAGFGGTDNTIPDLTSYVNDGMAENGPSIRAGKFDTSLRFDGGSDYIFKDSCSGLSTSGLSVSLWVKQLGTRSYDMHPFSLFGGERFTVLVEENSRDYYLKAENIGGGLYKKQIGEIDDNWHHIAVVFDGDRLRGYLDGVEKFDVSAPGSISESDNSIYVGTSGSGSTPSSGYYSGQIDSFYVWNRPLSSREVGFMFEQKIAPTDLNDGVWVSKIYEFGELVNPENLECEVSIDNGENLYALVKAYNNEGDFLDNSGWNALDNGSNSLDISSLPYCYKMDVRFRLQTDNSLHSPSVDSYILDATDTIPPSSFDLLSPENGTTLQYSNPTLRWLESSDIESGVSHYEVWIDGSNVENLIGVGNTTYNTDPLDIENHNWYIVAVDYFGNSRKSDNTFSFGIGGELSNGNVNGDDEVNIIDALQIARYDANLEPSPFYESVADVNDDEEIDIVDALMVAKYDAGLIDEF